MKHILTLPESDYAKALDRRFLLTTLARLGYRDGDTLTLTNAKSGEGDERPEQTDLVIEEVISKNINGKYCLLLFKRDEAARRSSLLHIQRHLQRQ